MNAKPHMWSNVFYEYRWTSFLAGLVFEVSTIRGLGFVAKFDIREFLFGLISFPDLSIVSLTENVGFFLINDSSKTNIGK